jgi:hypothetical protein
VELIQSVSCGYGTDDMTTAEAEVSQLIGEIVLILHLNENKSLGEISS